MDAIRLYVDAKDLASEKLLTPLLYGFTGLPDWTFYHEKLLKIGVFDRYAARKSTKFELTSLADCDYILFPYDDALTASDAWIVERRQAYAEYANKSGKPVVFFYSKDPEINRFTGNLPFAHPLIFATSIFKSTQPEFVYSQPGFIVDPLPAGQPVTIRPKQALPVVGFCGYAAPLGVPWGKYRLQEEVRLLLDQFGLLEKLKVDGFHTSRVRALKKLAASRLVQSNFIIRHYSAFDTNNGLFGEGREQRVQQYRQEYFDNLHQSDYIVCARGHGNFSYRLYETLACGRIPVFIDTNAALPLESVIDWQRYCVWISQRDIAKTDRIVRAFHDRLTPEAFAQLQADCRRLWEEFLTPEGFFGQVAHLLRARKQSKQTVTY